MNAGHIAVLLSERMERLAVDLVGSRPTSRHGDELRFYPKGGLAVVARGTRRGLWCDHGSGAGGDALDLVRHMRGSTLRDALDWAVGWLGLAAGQEIAPRHERPRETAPDAPPRSTLPFARKLWAEAVPTRGTAAETYLRSRGLDLPAGDHIRFHPCCPRDKERFPAMLALMTDPATGEPVGVHRTLLRPDGAGKAAGQAKMMLGGAGVVRLVPDEDVSSGLGLAEGIETALAIMHRAGWRPIWACCSTAGFVRFPVLSGIECLTMFPDLDDRGAGVAAARVCASKWAAAGREVQIIEPPSGTDWDDALVAAA